MLARPFDGAALQRERRDEQSQSRTYVLARNFAWMAAPGIHARCLHESRARRTGRLVFARNYLKKCYTPFVLRYRSTNGSQGRGLEQFALRYLRANGEF